MLLQTEIREKGRKTNYTKRSATRKNSKKYKTTNKEIERSEEFNCVSSKATTIKRNDSG